MSAAVHRGWLVAALVLAVSLLVASITVVATHAAGWPPADVPPWGTSQDRAPDRDGTGWWDGTGRWDGTGMMGRTGMMGGTGWADERADRRETCLDVLREREAR